MSDRLNLVVLDGYAMNPGDLDWVPLQAIAEVTLFDRSTSVEAVERAKDADIVLVNKTALPAPVLDQLPKLKCVCVSATGTIVIDHFEATARNITICNVPAYSTPSVVQMVFAHLLHFTQQVARHNELVTQGAWRAQPDFCFWESPLSELQGKTFGIIGLGQIGTAVAQVALAFGMNVIATRHSATEMPEGITRVDQTTCFNEADVLSLHCPLTAETNQLICKETLALMKPSLILINTGRGQLINEAELAGALNAGQIAGAGLDVLTEEPHEEGNPLVRAKNCVITPHIAWATKAARQRCLDVSVENAQAFIRGTPKNVVG